MQSLSTQLFAFGITILVGLLIGVFFDLYRVARGIIKPKKVFTYLGDTIFWLISTIVIFLFLLFGNWGEVRLYVFIGMLLGTALYLKIFSAKLIKAILVAIRVLRTIKLKIVQLVLFLYKIVTYPICLISSIVVIPVGFVSKKIILPSRVLAKKVTTKIRVNFKKKRPPKE